MVKGDVIFCATGVTNGDLVKGISDKEDYYEASTFVLQSSKTNKKVTNKHYK